MASRDWIPTVGETVKIRHEDRVEVVTEVKPIHHWSHEDYDPFPVVTSGGFVWRLIEVEPVDGQP